MNKLAILLPIILILIACEEIIDWSPKDTTDNRVVVQAILTDEDNKQEIMLTGLLSNINGEAEGISGADIKVYDEDKTYLFKEVDSISGLYRSIESFAIKPGKEYTMEIERDGEFYTASASAVASLPMRDFGIIRHGETDSVYIGGLGVEYSVVEQAMYEFNIDWSAVLPTDRTKAKQVHYVFSSINIGQLFGPGKAQFVFPAGSTVIIRKYSLADGFAEYLRSLVIETQWKGGFFEETNGNLPTNLSHGALGYFGVCTVQADTLIAR